MTIDPERRRRNQEALTGAKLDGIISPYASEVLLLTGYWPVMNASVAMSTAAGETVVVLPEDEVELAKAMCDARLIPYTATTLDVMRSAIEGFADPVEHALKELRLDRGRLGVQTHQNLEPVAYLASTEYRRSFLELLRHRLPDLELVSCDDLVEELKGTKTPGELGQMRLASRIVQTSFEAVPGLLRAGLREAEVAGELQRFFASAPAAEEAQRSYGFFFCMSGPNAASASAAYARTRQRRLEEGDLVMIHANTCCDGFWTDITRTYTVGDPSPRQQGMRAAIDEARAAAFAAIRPGAKAAAVDHAARSVMESRGFGKAFRHATGHGVGFAAANGAARPRIHPVSPDLLAEGMTFNIEPAAYFSDYGGMRHCDVVAVTDRGVDVLTDF